MHHRSFPIKRLSPIEFLILIQLKRKPMYGYEIIKELKKVFESVWEPKTGTIYPALRRLETKGLIRTELKEDREYYVLTEEGENVMKENLSLVEKHLNFAEKYYRCVSWHLPPRLKERVLRRFIGGHHFPFFINPLHLIEDIEDKDTKLELLRAIRSHLKRRLEAIESKIAKLEKEGQGE